jgi:hypothetical protein
VKDEFIKAEEINGGNTERVSLPLLLTSLAKEIITLKERVAMLEKIHTGGPCD